MHLILYNGDKFKKYKARKRKKGFLIFFGALLAIFLACACALSALGHWSDIKALFTKEEHVHSWRIASLKNASCAEDGLVLRCCEGCDAEEKLFLSAYGHNLENNVCVDCGKRASDGLAFSLRVDEEDEGYVVITGMGECTDRNIIIPNIIGGYPVTEIAASAFKGNTELRSVAINEGMKKLGEDAFADCSNLYMILLPESLDEFGALGAFNNTAYYNDEKNWDEYGRLYRQGYLLETIQTIA